MAAKSRGDGAKRRIITMRVTDSMGRKIDEAAEESGRSVSQEIEERLALSFREDELAGNAGIRRLMRAIGTAVDAAEGRTGREWWKDPKTFLASRRAVTSILESNRPFGMISAGMEEARCEMSAAYEHGRAIREEYDDFLAAHPEINEQLEEGLKNNRVVHLPPELELEHMRYAGRLKEANERYREVSERYFAARQPYDVLLDEAEPLAKEAIEVVKAFLRITPNEEGSDDGDGQ